MLRLSSSRCMGIGTGIHTRVHAPSPTTHTPTHAPARTFTNTHTQTAHTPNLLAGVVSPVKLAKKQAEEEVLFTSLHPKSREMAHNSCNNLLAGVPMPWMNKLPGSFPLFFTSAVGSMFRDVDGLQYVDMCLGDTGAMTGHAVPEVADALTERARNGITTMLPSPDAGWVGAELCRRFGLPYWQMAMTATDANRFVLRYARYLTGRPKVAVMDWCYHGTVDETLAILAEDGSVVPRPGAVGPQVDVRLTTRVAHFNDIQSLKQVLSYGDVACVLMEPALTNIGIVLPQDGYLAQLQDVCKHYGTLLVLDETHTICAGPGGATAAWGLSPDMLVIGKPIGGGMPAAAYGMTTELAERLLAHLSSESVDVSGVGGTLTANALALAAVRATLTHTLREEDYQVTIPLATAWTEGIMGTISALGLPWSVQQLGCRAEYWFCPVPKNGREAAARGCPDLERYMHLYALNRGVLLTPFHNMALFSKYHTHEQVHTHTRLFREAVEELLD